MKKHLIPLLISLVLIAYLSSERLVEYLPARRTTTPESADLVATTAAEKPPLYQVYQDPNAAPSRLALYLRSYGAGPVEGDWPALVDTLQAQGVPFTATRNPQVARRHRVVLIYPAFGDGLDAAVEPWRAFVEAGGTVIAVDAHGLFVQALIGQELEERRVAQAPFEWCLGHISESTARLGICGRPLFKDMVDAGIWSPVAPGDELEVWAVYADQTPAIVARRIGKGLIIATGFDAGTWIAAAPAATEGISAQRPQALIGRLLRRAYAAGEVQAVILGESKAQGARVRGGSSQSLWDVRRVGDEEHVDLRLASLVGEVPLMVPPAWRFVGLQAPDAAVLQPVQPGLFLLKSSAGALKLRFKAPAGK